MNLSEQRLGTRLLEDTRKRSRLPPKTHIREILLRLMLRFRLVVVATKHGVGHTLCVRKCVPRHFCRVQCNRL